MTDVYGPQRPTDERQVVRSFNDDGSANFAQVGIQEVDFKGRWGALCTSATENEISIGDKYFVVDFNEDFFRVGDDVLITSYADRDCYMWGEIIGKDTEWSPARIRVFVDDLSPVVGTFGVWEIQVVARPKPGIEKDVSFSTVDPTDDGPFEFEVTAGKFFPVGGQLLLKPNSDRAVALLGKVLAFEGTSLTVSKTVTNTTTPADYDSWSISLLDAPPSAFPLDGIAGLTVSLSTLDSAHDFVIQPGTVRDSTDVVDLVLPSMIVKRMDAAFSEGSAQGAQVITGDLPGLITTNGTTAVVGTGTQFLSDFATGSVLRTGNGFKYGVASVADNTHMTMQSGVPSATNAFYQRGGHMTTLAGDYGDYYLVVGRRDSDGHVDIFSCSVQESIFSRFPDVDLPSGYTYHRVIAYYSYAENEILLFRHLISGINTVGFLVVDDPVSVLTPNAKSILTAGSVQVVQANSPFSGGEGLEFSLVGDTDTPGSDKVYGTDSSGVRCWKDDPAGGGGGGIPTDWGLITDPIDAEETLDFGTIA